VKVVAKRKEAEKRINNGLQGTVARDTFAAEAKRWEDVVSLSLNLTTLSRRSYVDVLNLHVLPVIGKLKIAELLPSHIAEVMVSMKKKGLSPSYQHQAHKAMSHVFKMGIADGVIATNPTKVVSPPRGTVQVRVVPDRDLVKALVSSAPDERLKTFIVLAAHTGLRISEVFALTWADVKLDAHTISVHNGKGGKSRAVYLTPTLAAQLKVWKVEQTRQRLASSWWSVENDWLITSDIGTQMDTHNWRKKHFKPFTDKAAPGLTPHSLRHAFATLMLEEGVPMRVVAEQMGHSSTRITEQTYSHVTARLQAEAGAAVERALGGI